MKNINKGDSFFKILGLIALAISALTLILLICQVFDSTIEGNWFGTFIFFIFILAIAGIFINLGDPNNLLFIANYYGMALLFLSIAMYSFFSILYVFKVGDSNILSFTPTSLKTGKYIDLFDYLKMVFLILVFGVLGVIGFFQPTIKDVIVPKIIPYTLAVVGMLIAVLIGFKYLMTSAPADKILGELILFALGAGGFYSSARKAQLF